MPEACLLPYALIPLCSQEQLWEWDIVTDSLFFSHGAIQALKLEIPPATMPEFYQLVPADAAVELAAVRESVVSGKSGSQADCGYICNGFWVQEHILTLARNSEGRATRLLGHLAVSTMQKYIGFKSGQTLLPEAGIWLYDVKKGQIWTDPICKQILGQKSRNAPSTWESSLGMVHPTEREAIRRHYELLCRGNFLGDSITDLVRLKSGSGEYLPILLRATVMERDEEGHALLVSGIMGLGEPAAAIHSLSKDDKLFHALNSMGSGQWNWDTIQDAIYFCPRYLAMLGYGPEDEEEFARTWLDHVHPDDLVKVRQAHQQIIASADNGDTYECTYRMRRADGGWAWIFDRGCVTWRETDGRAGHMIGSITNITTAQAERDQLEELIRHDSLTGLRSRAFCNLEIEHIEQNDIRPVSVISLDITGLKMINDYLGHARGDELLMTAASIMRGALRRSDCVARVGGDEFLILLAGCDEARGRKVLAKLKTAFASYNENAVSLPVIAAMGLASSDSMDQSMSQIMARADAEMYRDKKEQRIEAHAMLKAYIKSVTGRLVGADERLG